MYSKSYSEFPNQHAGAFLIPASQWQMFVALKDFKPDVYNEILAGVKMKAYPKTTRQTLVTIYGDYNDGHCPKQLKSFEDFAQFPEFDVMTQVAPQQHNSEWITESISVIAHY